MVECHIVALKVVGSSPTIRPRYFKSSLGGIGRRDRLKICSFLGCWFESNSEQFVLNFILNINLIFLCSIKILLNF